MDSLSPSPDFGDYCVIEQHRYGAPNEHYLYKVLGRVETNAWKTVPAKLGEPEVLHPNIEPCVRVMCCTGSRIDTFNIKDIRPPVGFNVPQWNRRAPGESPAPTPEALDLEAVAKVMVVGLKAVYAWHTAQLSSRAALEGNKVPCLPEGEGMAILEGIQQWEAWSGARLPSRFIPAPAVAMDELEGSIRLQYRDSAEPHWIEHLLGVIDRLRAPASPTPGAPRPMKLRADARYISGKFGWEYRIFRKDGFRLGQSSLSEAEAREIAYRINSFEATPDPLEGAGEGRQG